MTGTLYVRSAGCKQGDDYFWKNVTEAGQEAMYEPDLYTNFKHLLQPKRFSILIARWDGQLVLLIANMISSRKDRHGRDIYNSILLADLNTEENERTIRRMAISALTGSLEAEIDRAVVNDSTVSFTVSLEAIRQIIKQLPGLAGDQAGSSDCLLCKDSRKSRAELARTLSEEGLPPSRKSKEVLAVVAPLTEEELRRADVWRGLSEYVEREEWYTYEKFFRSAMGGPKKRGMGERSPREGDILEHRRKTKKANTESVVIRAIVFLILVSAVGALLVHLFSPKLMTFNFNQPQVQAASEQGPVKVVAISPDARIVVSGSEDGIVKVWDVQAHPTERFRIQCHQGTVLAVAISNDSKTIVSGGEDGQVRVFTIPSDATAPQCREG